MTIMVARGSCEADISGNGGRDSPPIPIMETASRNKRKLRADPPLQDPSSPPTAQAGYPGYDELFLAEKPLGISCLERPGLLAYGSEKEAILNECRDADWNNMNEAQLEGILLSNLVVIYDEAVRCIASHGYTGEVASCAILCSGLSYGCKDAVVDNALAYLRGEREAAIPSSRVASSDDFRRLARSVLVDAVNVLRELRPSLSMGEAMWCLLISDMNVSQACAVEGDALSRMGAVPSSRSRLPSEPAESCSAAAVVEVDAPIASKPDGPMPFPRSALMQAATECLRVAAEDFSASSELQSAGKFASPIYVPGAAAPTLSVGTENALCSPCPSGESLTDSLGSPYILPEQRTIGGRKAARAGSTKQEQLLRQRSLHFEKNYRVFGSKTASRGSKHGGLGGTLLEKKCRPLSELTSTNSKSSSSMMRQAQVCAAINLSLKHALPARSSYSSGDIGASTSLPIADTELSLALPMRSTSELCPGHDYNFEATNRSSYTGVLSRSVAGEHLDPRDKKDDLLAKLASRIREMQSQLQGWTDWTQQKVMQAALRLSKDKSELQTLRQEREEAASQKREKQALEESNMKRFLEIENALSKASGQVEKANVTARRLEMENSILRQQMEAAKTRAAESAASCEEVCQRELSTRKRFQSWEREKALLQEEIAGEKLKLPQMLQKLDKEKEYREQIEDKWKQEEKAKDESLALTGAHRKGREQSESSGKSKDNALKLQASNDSRKYADEIQRLEKQIAQLRLVTDSPKITALKRTPDAPHPPRVPDGGRSNRGTAACVASKTVGLADDYENGDEDVPRELECVMCLTEEMSVVFLPCAHQVVCKQCNELHQEQGLKNCPSCRTLIQQRIFVLSSANS